ncbi:hypothetical protein [Moorena sp. SIO3H5]|nr:hypothetical protein [Moorena sp. SIO3H5]NEO70620.1 hypothetical protein [Moorena sp. SIO3H5]
MAFRPPLREQPESRLEKKKIRDLHAFSDGQSPAFSDAARSWGFPP